jgi:hypothetical protein
MKIKTLLITGAALAFSAVTSLATTVTFNIPGGNAISFITVPWYAGEDTTAILESYFQGGENVWTWHGTGYYVYTYEGSGVGTTLGFQSDWIDASSAPPAPPTIPGDQTDTSDDVYWAPAPVFAPAQSFFVQNPNSTCHVSVSSSTPVTPTINLPGNSAYDFFGNATLLSNVNAEDPSIGLTADFAGGENVWVWTGTGWDIYTFEGAGVGTGLGYPSDWTDGSGTDSIPGDVWDAADEVWWTQPLDLQLAQGLIIQNPNSIETWIQSISW